MSIYDDIETMGMTGDDYVAPIADHDEIALQARLATQAMLQALQDSGLEGSIRTAGYAIVNAIHREVERLDRKHDDNASAIRQLVRDQDGTEVKDVELQTAMVAQARLEETRGALETFRDAAAEAYTEAAGEPWIARSGSRTGRIVTAAQIDARAMLKAARDKRAAELNPEGPRFVVSGSKTWSNVDGAFRALDRLHALNPDMVLVTKGGPGAELVAQKWASLRGVPQIVQPMDWRNRNRAAFLAIDAMLEMQPAGVVILEDDAHPLNGPGFNLIDKAEKQRISVWRPKFAAGPQAA